MGFLSYPFVPVGSVFDPILRRATLIEGEQAHDRITASAPPVDAGFGGKFDGLADVEFMRHCRLPRKSGRRQRCLLVALRGLEVDRRGLALLATLKLIANPLAFDQVAQPRTLDSGDMDKHVLRAVFRLDESIALLRIKPLHDTDGHRASLRTNHVPAPSPAHITFQLREALLGFACETPYRAAPGSKHDLTHMGLLTGVFQRRTWPM